MSVILRATGVLQKPATVRLTATTITDIYTAIDSLDTIIAITAVNETATPCELLIDLFNGAINQHIWAASFTATARYFVFDVPIKPLNGNKIRATASVVNLVSVAVHTIKAMRGA